MAAIHRSDVDHVHLAGNEVVQTTAITYVGIMVAITLGNKPTHRTRKQARAFLPPQRLIPITPYVGHAISLRTTHQTWVDNLTKDCDI